MKIHQITFSPTGRTRRVCEYIYEGIDARPFVTDLCVKEGQIRVPEIHEDDLVIIAMPVFAGRIPALAVKRLKRIQSNHAKCAVVAVYGNRAYDDALLEMQDVATEMGFRVVAAVSAVAEHSIARIYAAGRPDAEDRKELAAFGAAIINKVEGTDVYKPLSLPGNRPYRAGNTGPFPRQMRGVQVAAHAMNSVQPMPYLPTISEASTRKPVSPVCVASPFVLPKQGTSDRWR